MQCKAGCGAGSGAAATRPPVSHACVSDWPPRPSFLLLPSCVPACACASPSRLPRPFCLLHGGDRLQNWSQEEGSTPRTTAHGGSNGEGGDRYQSVSHRLPYTAQQTAGLYVHPLGSASRHSIDPVLSSPKDCCTSPSLGARRRAAHRWMRLAKAPPAPAAKAEAPVGRKVIQEKRVLPKLFGPFFLRRLGPPSEIRQFLRHGARTRTEEGIEEARITRMARFAGDGKEGKKR
jgi:hypothetical protein